MKLFGFRCQKSTVRKMKLCQKPQPKIKQKPKLGFIGIIIALLAMMVTSAIGATRTNALECFDLQIIFARGSGESLGDKSETAWRTSLDAGLQESSLSYQFYELGSIAQKGKQYPAVAVAGSLNGIANLVGAYVSAGTAYEFGSSVYQGQQELENYLTEVSYSCPQTKFVLGGYSQGAMVISGMLDRIDAKKVVYVATFGDPKIYLPEGKGIIPDACIGKNLSNYRANVVDCRAYKGILGAYQPYQPKTYYDKLGTWCNGEDIMCSSKMSLQDHTSYASTNLYAQASDVILNKIRQTFPDKLTSSATKISFHDIVILIDSTGSMGPIINTYKAEAKRLAQKNYAQGGRVALYEYRDLSDPFAPRELCNFECNYDEFVRQLEQIEVGGGGDAPESVLNASLHVMNSMKWQMGASKSIILLTDNGYLSPDRDGTSFHQVVKRSLEIDPVNIYTLTPPGIMPEYEELTLATGGKTFNLEEEIELSTESVLNKPVVNFPLAQYVGYTTQNFSFSLDTNIKNDAAYEYLWDLDGDDEYEIKTTTPNLEYQFQHAYSGYVKAKAVSRNSKNYSLASTKVDVMSADSETLQLAAIESLTSQSLDSGSAQINFVTHADQTLLVINQQVMGFLTEDQRQITLTDMTGAIEVTLVPYDRQSGRGISKSIKVYPKIPYAPQTGIRLQRRCQLSVPNLNDNGLHNHTCKPLV